jgi:hypothetical protein
LAQQQMDAKKCVQMCQKRFRKDAFSSLKVLYIIVCECAHIRICMHIRLHVHGLFHSTSERATLSARARGVSRVRWSVSSDRLYHKSLYMYIYIYMYIHIHIYMRT